MDPTETSAEEAATRQSAPKLDSPGARLARNMVFYTIVRLLMVVVLALLITWVGNMIVDQFPLLVGAIFAVIIALPLSMILFSKLRAQINSDIAEVDAGRREKREDLRRRMNDA